MPVPSIAIIYFRTTYKNVHTMYKVGTCEQEKFVQESRTTNALVIFDLHYALI